jgi:uncharacterized membrane protein YidH (DUF202 family)
MTSIGFLFFVIGFVFVRWFGVSAIDSLLGHINIFDQIGIPLIYIGFVLMLAGISTWLWSVMP